MKWMYLLRFPLLDAAGDGTGGGAAAGSTGTAGAGAGSGGASGTPATGSGAAATGTGTPSGEAARTGAATSGFTYKEDRSDWVPKHRFNEVNQKAARVTEYEAAIAERDRKIAALAGVTPQDPNATKTEQLRAAMVDLFPQLGHLKDLTDEQMQRLLQSPDQASRAVEIEQREQARHGKAQMTALYLEIAEHIGADELSADQKADLRDGFSSWLKAKCNAEIQSTGDSATLTRYENGDPDLLREFAKRHSANWVEPARRKLTANTVARTRPVPNSQGRAQVTSLQRPAKFANMDDRLDFAAKSYLERGGQFGGPR